MLYLFLHLIVLIYVSSSLPGALEYKPMAALGAWLGLTIVVFFALLPKWVNKKLEDNIIPDFFKTQNQFQWAITLWILALQLTANPAKLIYPNYAASFEQTMPMLVSCILYYFLSKATIAQFRRLMSPILPPDQTKAEFFRARITSFILAMPPILLWMLIEDTSRSGLAIIYEIKIITLAPLFFVGLFILAPKLFNWAWQTKSSHIEDLNTSIQELALKTQTKISGVKIWNTFGEPLANAAVAGLSKNFRYVYVTEYLLEIFNPKQVSAVIAHELGHLKLGHVFTYTIFSILILLLSLNYKLTMYLFFPNIDVNGFTFSLLEGGLFLFIFIFSFTALSRFSEHQADVFSSIIVSKDTFVSVITQLNEDLEESVKKIPQWLCIHPTNSNRILKINENLQENTEILLQQARKIRYAMLALSVILLITMVYPIGNVMKISALYEAKQAKNELLLKELASSLPSWLKNHPEVLEILHHPVSPEVTLNL